MYVGDFRIAYELLSGSRRMTDEVADVFLKLLVRLVAKPIRLQRPLTRE